MHDVIEIDCELTRMLIDSEVFQRLRRIKQLGLASFVYPGAEHTRFSHSLGAFHLAKKLTGQLQKADPNLYSEEELRAIPIAALCHDIGHGPFSHLFEKVTKDFVRNKKQAKHEYWSELVLSTHAEVKNIFRGQEGLQDIIWRIIKKTYPQPYVNDVISSELDVDRLDYLLRDSLMTGVKYGSLDLAWVLRCIQPAEILLQGKKQKVLAIDATRGMSVLESYILGRHYMYRHLYWYHTVRSAEQMLKTLLSKVLDRVKNGFELPVGPVLEKLAKGDEISLTEYLSLDDSVIWQLLDNLISQSTPFADLAYRIKVRKIFRTINFSIDIDTNKLRDSIEQTAGLATKAGLDPSLYVIYDDPSDIAMKSLTFLKAHNQEDKFQPLYYFDKSKKVFELNNSDNFVNKISFSEKRLYVPAEIYAEAKTIWQ